MWHPAALYLAVLFCTTFVDGQSTCDSDGPDNCTFDYSLSSCSWTFGLYDWVYDISSAVFGTGGSLRANMTSRTACSTRGDTHCLQIRYLFRRRNKSIRDEDGDENIIWNSPDRTSGVWQVGVIPIGSDASFQVTIEARIYEIGYGRIYIDYIRYVKSPCQTPQTSAAQSPVTIVGVVVGVVIVVVVVAVAVAIFVLYRQKRLHLWRTCFKNSKRTDTAVTSPSRNREETLKNNGRNTSIGAISTSGHDTRSLYLTPTSHEYTYITASPNTESDSSYINQHSNPTPKAHKDKEISTAEQSLYLTPTASKHRNFDWPKHNVNYVNQQLYTTLGARSQDNDYSVIGNTAGSDAALPHNPNANPTMRPDNQNSRETFRRTSDDPYEVV